MTVYSDETLLAYMQGDLDEAAAATLEAAVAEDPELEARLMALDPLAAPVRDAFRDVPSDAQLSAIKLPEKVDVSPNLWLRGVASVAALICAGAIGFAVAFGGREAEETPMTWQMQAALYQALYVAETVAPITATEESAARQLTRAERALARSLPRDALVKVEGLTFKRAQVLAFSGQPLIQVAYAAADGTPFALCIFRQGDGGADGRLGSEVLAGLASATWSEGDYGYMLIGGGDLDFVAERAAVLATVL